MSELSKTSLQNLLERQLQERNLDVVDVVPIPQNPDRLTRLKNLQEVLEDFDRSVDSETKSYLIQIKPKRSSAASGLATLPAQNKAIIGNKENFVRAQPNAVQNSENQGENKVETEISSKKSAIDGIYLTTGKLNISFLAQNAGLLFQSGEFGLARNIYKTIVQSGERSALGLFGIAKCLEAEGKLEEARSYYEESIAYQPDLETYLRLSSLFLKLEKATAAADTLVRALHIKGLQQAEKLDIHRNIALCCLKAGDKIKAQQHFEKALEISPANDEITSQLGLLHLGEKQYADAKKRFHESVAVNPKNAEALYGIATCFLNEGDKRTAHDYFAKSLDAKINNPSAIYHLVKCAFELKTYATAARIVEEYTEMAPVNASLLYSLAGLQFHLGRIENSRQTITRILNIAPNHTGAKELLSMIDRYTI